MSTPDWAHIYIRRRLPGLLTIWLLLFTWAGPAGAEKVPQGGFERPGATDAPPAAYLLGPGDRLNVVVLTQPESEQPPHGHDLMSFNDLLIQPDGTLELPLAGQVQAAGKTAAELAALITDHFRRFYRSPLVTVNLSAPRTTVSVTGMVRAGGTFPIYQPRVPFLKALAFGQGLVETADVNRVLLIRAPERGGEILQIDMDKAAKEGSLATLALEPGDSIYVPPRSRWEFDLPVIFGLVGAIASIVTTILVFTRR